MMSLTIRKDASDPKISFEQCIIMRGDRVDDGQDGADGQRTSGSRSGRALERRVETLD